MDNKSAMSYECSCKNRKLQLPDRITSLPTEYFKLQLEKCSLVKNENIACTVLLSTSKGNPALT